MTVGLATEAQKAEGVGVRLHPDGSIDTLVGCARRRGIGIAEAGDVIANDEQHILGRRETNLRTEGKAGGLVIQIGADRAGSSDS